MSKLTPKGKTDLRARRHRRIRARVRGTASRPRLTVFRSNKYMYAQIIDDDRAVTLAAATSKGTKKKMSMMEAAVMVGTDIAQAAKAAGVTQAVFDRSGFKYAGRIAALADAARKGGLTF